MRRLLILLFSVTLLAAACGDDDASSGDADVATDTDADDDAGAADDADDEEGAADDTDDDAGADDDTDDADDDDMPTGAGVGSDFCATYNDTSDDVSNPFLLSPDELEDWYRDTLSTIDDVRGSAPGEIRDDVDTLFANFVDFVEALEDVDWDFTAVDQTDPIFDSPEAEAATERVEAFCDDGSDGDEIQIPGLDVDDLEDLEDLQDQFENADPEELGLQFYELLGHDEETARCLVDELGADFDVDDAGADIMTQEFCGLTLFEILGGGLGG